MDSDGPSQRTHARFCDFYERFIEAAYAPTGPFGSQRGRLDLVDSVAAEVRRRNAATILDCAAGSGFPSLEMVRLFRETGEDVLIHCTDGDAAMIDVLQKRALDHDIDTDDLAPARWMGKQGQSTDLVMDWSALQQIPDRYDYVMCRGNSLAYADTWTGRIRVANEQLVASYLALMIDRIEPGGHLHVDGPWTQELRARNYRDLPGLPDLRVWEQVSVDRDHREWWVTFTDHSGQFTFKRYSSLLTIHEVSNILKALGMEETSPFQLKSERLNWGTIIARKPD